MMKSVLESVLLFLAAASVGAGVGVEPGAAYDEAAMLCRQFPERSVGYPGNDAVARYVAAEFAKLARETGAIRFRQPVLSPGRGELSVGQDRWPVLPLGPNLADPGNLPEDGWQGRLVYAGRGEPGDLESRRLQGAAAVMEFNCERNWLSVVQSGASVILFLAPTETSAYQARSKQVDAPLTIPRFLVPRQAVAAVRDLARRVPGPQARLKADRRRWRRVTLEDPWAIVPGTTRADEVVHFQVALDSASICSGVDPGAEAAANLAVFLRVFRAVAARPVSRTVVFSAVNAHRSGMAGARAYTWHTFAPDSVLEEEDKGLEDELAVEQYKLEAYSRTLSADLVERVRTETSNVAGKTTELRKPIQELLTTRLNEGRQAIAHLLQALRRETDPQRRAALKADVQRIRADGDVWVRLVSLFNKFGRRTGFEDLSGPDRARLQAAFDEVVRNARTAVTGTQADLTENRNNRRLRELLNGKRSVLYCFLDCSFHNDRVGFFNQSHMQAHDYPDLVKAVVKFSRDTLRLAEAVSTERSIPNCLEDTILNNGGVAWSNHLAEPVVTPTLFGNQALVPSVALLTVQDIRRYRYTTLDDLEHLPRRNVERISAFLEAYLPTLFDRGVLDAGYKVPGRDMCAMTRMLVRKVDAFSLTVPKLPVPNALVVLRPWRVLAQGAFWEPVRGDVNMNYPMLSDGRGSAVARMLRRGTGYYSEVFGFDPQGRIAAALDLGRMETRFSSNLGSSLAVTERILAAFPCVKYDLVGLIEPLTFEPVRSIDVIDALQESTPMSFGLSGVSPNRGATKKYLHTVGGCVAAIFVPPDLPVKLRLGRGLLLNSSADHPTGAGYVRGELPAQALRYATARDTWVLDEDRLSRLESKGVHNALARELHTEAGRLLDQAADLRRRGRMQQFLNRATEALGVEYRAYPAILSTSNDMVKSVVIFLGLVIPFCFFVMKLTCPFTQVTRQITWFVGVFAVTFLWLRTVHPVFQLTHAPTIVLIAFVMLGLALFVSWILYARFDEEMGKVLNQFTDADSSDASRSRLAGVAFSVGVNNMKRRRIRTGLTCITVVLVTFTMLSFTSVTESARPARARLPDSPPYNGYLYTNPGFAALDRTVVRSLRALFAEHGKVVSRVWAQRLNQYGGYMPYELTLPGSDKVLEAKVMLGLEKAEDGFVRPIPLKAGRWLSGNDAAELVLSVRAASFVGITPENLETARLVLNGVELKVVGLVDDERFEAIEDIAGVPLLPLEQTASLAAAQKQAQTMHEAAAQGSASPTAGSAPVRAQDVAITSTGFARLLGGAGTRVLAVRFPDARTAWTEANRVIRFSNNRLLLGLREEVPVGEGSAVIRAGTYGLLPSMGKQVGGLARIIIPLIIGATIILNTMLGAVMERRREIGIYNAIGLNPTHVAVFFLAEALVFGVVGAVAGYLVGQSLSKIIVAFGWMSAVNMNYSSLTVIMVIFMAIATVLVSAIYPALLATRAAVPSGKRKWALPIPEGDEMKVDFPFSYDEERVLAVLGYLYSYFELNSEASSGRFVAEPLGFGRVRERDGNEGAKQPVWAMVYDVSLAPFDLGVNQRVEVYAYFDDTVGAYRITMHLTRTAGEKSNWMTANQPFLEGLRKHLLRWRSQNALSQERYYEQGSTLFADAPLLA